MKSLLLKIWSALHLSKAMQLFAMRRVNDQFLIGVMGIIFNQNSEILLVKHTYRSAKKWRLPGGYLKTKEHPKEGLEREILEECGLVVCADERLKIRTDRDSSRLEIVYAGTLIGGEIKTSDEVEEVSFFSYDNLPSLPKDHFIFIDRAIQARKNSKPLLK